MNSISEENYLKCIYSLQLANAELASTTHIANRLGTKPSSVTSMLTKLGKSGMVDYTPYQGAVLTREGRKKAIQVVRKHRLWESFLVTKLGMSWEEVHEIAEQLEHIDSELLIEKLDNYLGYPHLDPHGDPIPDAKGRIKAQDLVLLETVEQGSEGTIRGVSEHTSEFLRFLDTMGLIPGQKIHIEKKEPFDGMLVVRMLPGNKKYHVSREVSSKILFERTA